MSASATAGTPFVAALTLLVVCQCPFLTLVEDVHGFKGNIAKGWRGPAWMGFVASFAYPHESCQRNSLRRWDGPCDVATGVRPMKDIGAEISQATFACLVLAAGYALPLTAAEMCQHEAKAPRDIVPVQSLPLPLCDAPPRGPSDVTASAGFKASGVSRKSLAEVVKEWPLPPMDSELHLPAPPGHDFAQVDIKLW